MQIVNKVNYNIMIFLKKYYYMQLAPVIIPPVISVILQDVPEIITPVFAPVIKPAVELINPATFNVFCGFAVPMPTLLLLKILSSNEILLISLKATAILA